MILPLVQEIDYAEPCSIFQSFHTYANAVFLDSAEISLDRGRYSFIALDPFLTISAKNGYIKQGNIILTENPFVYLAKVVNKFKSSTHPALPPFQGGLLGFFSYDLVHHLEHIKHNQVDDMQFPDLYIGLYDLVIAFDQIQKKAFIFSQGFPAKKNQRHAHARKRLAWLLKEMQNLPHYKKEKNILLHPRNIKSNFSKKSYIKAINKVINYIYAGDIFQANISQRFKVNLPPFYSLFTLYEHLRKINQAPFAAFLNFNDTVIISASPERFVKLQDMKVTTHPIKGTSARSLNKVKDQQLAENLQNSNKDRAENIMIVDLMRNDLSKVCKNHSVVVNELCKLYSFTNVHHLISSISGELQDDINPIHLLAALFPAGSITGAPKIRAMEIIAAIEPTFRGPYCGNIVYLGFDGQMDSSILIRTFCYKNNQITFQAGGAIVALSNPVLEYEETLTKIDKLYKALTMKA